MIEEWSPLDLVVTCIEAAAVADLRGGPAGRQLILHREDSDMVGRRGLVGQAEGDTGKARRGELRDDRARGRRRRGRQQAERGGQQRSDSRDYRRPPAGSAQTP